MNDTIARYLGIMPALLTVLFIHHKMLGTIDWNWWLVTAPITAPIALGFFGAAAKGFVRGYRRSNAMARALREGGENRFSE